MFAATLGTMILAGTLSSFLMLGRSGGRVSNDTAMESHPRRAFEQLGIDSLMAKGFVRNPSGSVVTSFTLTILDNTIANLNQRHVTDGDETGPHRHDQAAPLLCAWH